MIDIQKFTLDQFYQYVFKLECSGDYDCFTEYVTDLKERFIWFSFQRNDWRDEHLYVGFKGNRIVGILSYCVTRPDCGADLLPSFLNYVAVDGEYKNKKIATQLIQFWNQFRRKDIQCGCSGFTQEGYDWLRPRLVRMGIECKDYVEY